MAYRCRNFRWISALFSGLRYHECGLANNLSASSLTPLAYTSEIIVAIGACRVMHASRFSSIAARSKEVLCELDLISFIRSTFYHAEAFAATSHLYLLHTKVRILIPLEASDMSRGPNHCWINRFEDSNEFSQKDEVYLLLAEAFLNGPPGSRGDQAVMLEKVKLLQQRYPWLRVFSCQSCSCISSKVDHNLVMDVITEEYISFPIVLSIKIFPEVASGACCILFKGLTLYNEKDVDLCTLSEVIKDLNQQLIQNAGNVDKLKSPWCKRTEGFREPYLCYQNLPLFLPACISADKHGDRFFLSDSIHHRVIVFDRKGKILDVVVRTETLRLQN